MEPRDVVSIGRAQTNFKDNSKVNINMPSPEPKL